MNITFHPPDLVDRLDPVLRELIQENAEQMFVARCATHCAAPQEVRVLPGTNGNLVDIELHGCCDEYELPDEEERT